MSQPDDVLEQAHMRERDVCRIRSWRRMHDSITGSQWEQPSFVVGPQYITVSRRGHGGTLRVSWRWRESDSAGVI